MVKRQTAFRLSDTARALLEDVASSMGLTLTAALEVIIREAAKKRKTLPTRSNTDAS